jgi:RNA polymerase sigma factor (sigma-70 family)
MESTSAASSVLDPLVRAAAGGDRDAFANLVDRTRTVVCSIAMAILRDVELSQDVAQDVFLSAWRDLRKLREPASFLPWLRQMTRNRAHHVLRSRVRERRIVLHDADAHADALLAVAADAATPAAALIAREDRERLAEAIDALPDEAREVVTLFYREGQSVRQVADLLGMREDAVKQRLSRARQKLRDSLLDEVGETLRTTAPGAVFTAGVMTMTLTMAAPSTAAAAGIGLSASKAAGAGVMTQIGAVLLGLAPGALFGGGGVVFGLRSYEKRARDEQELRDIRRLRAVALGVVLVAVTGLGLGYDLTGSRLTPIVVYIAFITSVGVIYLGWLPRIIERRLALERLEDPEAARRQRRNRIKGILAFALGAVTGGAALIAGLLIRAAAGH